MTEVSRDIQAVYCALLKYKFELLDQNNRKDLILLDFVRYKGHRDGERARPMRVVIFSKRGSNE